MATFKLSPSDFGFLWEECRRCFWLKVAKGFDRPSAPFPRIFNVIDGAMKACFAGKRSEDMAPGMPAGAVHVSDEWVESVPIARPGGGSFFIRGIFDTVLRLDDGTYAVIDFKTSTIGPDQVAKYGRQLHAYALALERAAPGRLKLEPISTLGLLVYEPDGFAKTGEGTATLGGKLGWLEIERDEEQFMEFLDEVMAVLNRSDPPPAGRDCRLCQYREASRRKEW